MQSPSEDEAYISYEEASQAYVRLQHDYQKFLSECGIVNGDIGGVVLLWPDWSIKMRFILASITEYRY